MKEIYNIIYEHFKDTVKVNTAISIADAYYFGTDTRYNACNCGVSEEEYKTIKEFVFNLMAEDF